MQRFRDEFGAIFLGALGDSRVPSNVHAKDILLGARFELDLYVNLRPIRLLNELFPWARDTVQSRHRPFPHLEYPGQSCVLLTPLGDTHLMWRRA